MLQEHVVGGEIVLPGVGYLELALAAVFDADVGVLVLKNSTFVRPCVVSADTEICLSFNASGAFEIASCPGPADGPFFAHAMGEILRGQGGSIMERRNCGSHPEIRPRAITS